MELEAPEFEQLRGLVYERTGLMFEDKRNSFLQARVARRLATVGCKDARDYYRYLRYQDAQGSEFQAFVESLTTNETYFFRDFPQLECFANEALPRIADAKRARGDFNLQVWSAACSTGDEPYTLAIILRECLDDFPRWKVQLLATDIDTRALNVARAGLYSERGVKDVPSAYLGRYFTASNGLFRLSDDVRKMVSFTQLNLYDRQAMRLHRNYDFVFCRNVLIYFDDPSRKQVLGSFYDALVPGGFIFLGHSESVGRISAAYEPLSLGNTIVYRKPVPGASRAGR